jgi:hypothetical protein
MGIDRFSARDAAGGRNNNNNNNVDKQKYSLFVLIAMDS